MMAHGQTADFWERSMAHTAKVNTVKNELHMFSYKNEKNVKTKSERSHRDSVKRMKASVTAALVKAKAEHAALLVRASYLKQKHEIEAKERAIQRRLEQLELETKLAEVNAKLAVLNASKNSKTSTSRSGQDEPKAGVSKLQKAQSAPDTGAGDELDWEGPEIYLPKMDVCEDPGTDEEQGELDWEGPEIFVPVVVVCENTGAGDFTEIPPALNKPNVPPSEALEFQEDVQTCDIYNTNTTLNKDCESRPVDQPPKEELVGFSEQNMKTADCAKDPVVEKGSFELEILKPLFESVSNGLSEDSSSAVKSLTITAFPQQTLGGPTCMDSGSMNSDTGTVAIVVFVLFLLVGQAHKLIQLKRYKTFKRKRWKCI